MNRLSPCLFLLVVFAASCGDRVNDPISSENEAAPAVAAKATPPQSEFPLFKVSFYQCKDGTIPESPSQKPNECGAGNFTFDVLCDVPANEVAALRKERFDDGWYYHFRQQLPPDGECIRDLIFRPPSGKIPPGWVK